MQEDQIVQDGNTDGNPTSVRIDEAQQNKDFSELSERVSEGEVVYRSEGPKLYTALGAATYLEWDEKTVRNWIKNGRLKAQKIAGSWQITEDDLNAVYVKRNLEKKREANGKSEDIRKAKEQVTVDEEPRSEREPEHVNQPNARSDYRSVSIKQHPDYVDLLIENEKFKAAKSGIDEVSRTKDELLRERADRLKEAEEYKANLTKAYTGRVEAMAREMGMLREENSKLKLLTAPKEEEVKRGLLSRIFGT